MVVAANAARKSELLSPAGSLPALQLAIDAGADAEAMQSLGPPGALSDGYLLRRPGFEWSHA
jgi:hypothetical protein